MDMSFGKKEFATRALRRTCVGPRPRRRPASVLWSGSENRRELSLLCVKLGFHIRGKRSGMRYALSGKNGKACKRTRVIPYVRIRHAICRAAANGGVCGKLNRSR